MRDYTKISLTYPDLIFTSFLFLSSVQYPSAVTRSGVFINFLSFLVTIALVQSLTSMFLLANVYRARHGARVWRSRAG